MRADSFDLERESNAEERKRRVSLAGILGLGRKFSRATKSGGIGSALRKSVKGVASRSGLASLEDLDALIGSIRAENDATSRYHDELSTRLQKELSARLHEESIARLEQDLTARQRIDSISEEIAKAQTVLAAIENQQLTTITDAAELRARA